MDTILAFITGGIFTLIILSVGSIIGYMAGSNKLEEKVEQVKSKLKKTPPDSGGVKAITPEEIKKEQEKGFIGKMKSIIE